jgi:two-component system chemotaxis sensor kinase CheA
MDEMDEIVGEFLVESTEILDRLDLEIVGLEEHPDSPELLAGIFRDIHTIKGTAGFFNFMSLESVSHAGENLLGLLRDGVLTLSSAHVTILLEMCDAIRQILGSIGSTGSEGSADYSGLTARLAAMVDPGSGDEPDTASSGETDDTPDTEDAQMDDADAPAPASEADADAEDTVEVGEAEAAPEPELVAEPEPEPAPQVTQEAPAESTALVGAPAETSIRVDVRLLDSLMNLVGELVLARNQVLQFQNYQGDGAF